MNQVDSHYRAKFLFDPAKGPQRLEVKARDVQGSREETAALTILITDIVNGFHVYDRLREQARASGRIVIAVELITDDIDESLIKTELGKALESFVVDVPDRLATTQRHGRAESHGKYRFSVTLDENSPTIMNKHSNASTIRGIRVGMEERSVRGRRQKGDQTLGLPDDQIRHLTLDGLLKYAREDPENVDLVKGVLLDATRRLDAMQSEQPKPAESGQPGPQIDISSLVQEGSRLVGQFAARNEPSVREFQEFLDSLARAEFKSTNRDSNSRGLILDQRKAIVDRVNQLRALVGVSLFYDEAGQPPKEVVNLDFKKGCFRFRGHNNTPIQENASWPKLKAVFDLAIKQAIDDGQTETPWTKKISGDKASSLTIPPIRG